LPPHDGVALLKCAIFRSSTYFRQKNCFGFGKTSCGCFLVNQHFAVIIVNFALLLTKRTLINHD